MACIKHIIDTNNTSTHACAYTRSQTCVPLCVLCWPGPCLCLIELNRDIRNMIYTSISFLSFFIIIIIIKLELHLRHRAPRRFGGFATRRKLLCTHHSRCKTNTNKTQLFKFILEDENVLKASTYTLETTIQSKYQL